MTIKINTIAKTAGEITVKVGENFDLIELLDAEPDCVDENWELLDIQFSESYHPFTEKLYKIPANDIFPAFTVICSYDFDINQYIIYYPSDFEDSGWIEESDFVYINGDSALVDALIDALDE